MHDFGKDDEVQQGFLIELLNYIASVFTASIQTSILVVRTTIFYEDVVVDGLLGVIKESS